MSLWRTVEDPDLVSNIERGAGFEPGEVLARTTAAYILESGNEVVAPFSQVDHRIVAGGLPVREFHKYRGQRNYTGFCWVATGERHVPYESLMERTRIHIADFDRSVTAIAAQPLKLSYQPADGDREDHFPDLLLARGSGRPLLVDIKPDSKLTKPGVLRQFAWTAAAALAKRWEYEVWTGGGDFVALGNLWLLAGYRRLKVVDQQILSELRTWRPPVQLAELEASLALRYHQVLVRPAVLHAIWHGLFLVDLAETITPRTWLTHSGFPEDVESADEVSLMRLPGESSTRTNSTDNTLRRLGDRK